MAKARVPFLEKPPSRFEPSGPSSLLVMGEVDNTVDCDLRVQFLVIGGAPFEDPDVFEATAVALDDEPDEDNASELGSKGDWLSCGPRMEVS